MRLVLGLALLVGLLLVGLALHPVRSWRAWRSLTVELFEDGGATIDTTAAEETTRLRTVIQPDGDVLVIVQGDEPSTDLVATHRAQVERWYEDNRKALRRSLDPLRAMMAAVSAAGATASGWSTFDALEGGTGAVAGLVAGAVVAPLLRLGIGALVAGIVRRRVARWLGPVGLGS